MKILRIIPFVALALFLLIGCESANKKTDLPALGTGDDVNKVTKNVGEVQSGMKSSADKIDEQTNAIRSSTTKIEETPKLDPNIKTGVNNIKTSTAEIDKQTAEIRRLAGLLEESKSNLSIITKKVSTLEEQIKVSVKERDDAIAERDKALAKANDATQKMLRWIVLLGIIGCAAGAAIIFVLKNTTLGLSVIVTSGTTIVLSVTLIKFIDYIAWGGLGILTVIVIYALYKAYLNSKALSESVEVTEVAKRNLPPAARMKIFGYGPEVGSASQIQSKTTQGLVAKIRTQLKPRLEHTIEDPSNTEMAKYDAEQRLAQAQNDLKALNAASTSLMV